VESGIGRDTTFSGMTSPAPSTGTFRFAKPDGFSYAPGQYFVLSLSTRDGQQSKAFTLDAAPGDPYLEITTRLTGSAFKDALLALAPGDLVRFSGPHGRMTLPDGTTKAAFLAGGVGITPAHSIIRDAVQRATGLQVALFYGNQDQDGIPFGAEFDGYVAGHPEIMVVHVLMAPRTGWSGETGFITADVVRRHVDPLDGWRWVIAGPPAMIDAMGKVVTELGIPADRVATESFAGYE
jgi:ferredoxin-NADP reductase